MRSETDEAAMFITNDGNEAQISKQFVGIRTLAFAFICNVKPARNVNLCSNLVQTAKLVII